MALGLGGFARASALLLGAPVGVSGQQGATGTAPPVLQLRDTMAAIPWSPRAASEANSWEAVAYAPELERLVAVSSDGTNRVMTSDDFGVTWTARAVTARAWRGVCWSSRLRKFVAVANSTSTAYTMTSSDGITWAEVVAPENNDWNQVICIEDATSTLFVSVARSGTNRCMTSVDGAAWTLRPLTASYIGGASAHVNGVGYSPDLKRIVVVSDSVAAGTSCATSDDYGVTWTSRSLGLGGQTWWGVTWSPKRRQFVAAANMATSNIARSSDGITWTTATIGGGSTFVRDPIWAPELNLYLVIADSGVAGQRVYSSPDAVTWTARTSAEDNLWRRLCWIPDLAVAVAVATSGTNRVMTSGSLYEEGVFTPALKFGGASVGLTYSMQIGQYTRIGRCVFVEIRVQLTAKGTSVGNATVQGLPRTVKNVANLHAVLSSEWYENITAAGVGISGLCLANGTDISLYNIASGAGWAALTDAAFALNSGFVLTGFYFI